MKAKSWIAMAAALALPLAAQATGSSAGHTGSHPPGMASPGTPRDATTSMDDATGATRYTKPNVADRRTEQRAQRKEQPSERKDKR